MRPSGEIVHFSAWPGLISPETWSTYASASNMFWICSRPAPPELMPGSMVLTIFAASGSRSVVCFAAPDGLGVPELDGVQAATASTTSRDSAISFLMHLLLAGKPAPNAAKDTHGQKRRPVDG